MATLKDAVDAFNNRIKAGVPEDYRVGDFGGSNSSLCGVTEDSAKLILSGFDLDPDEVMAYSERIAGIMLAVAAMTGLPLNESVAGVWFQGFMVGKLHSEIQAKEKVND